MKELYSHGAVGQPPVEEKQITTRSRMFHSILDKASYGVTFKAGKATEAKVTYKEKE